MAVDVLIYSDSGGTGGAERWLVSLARYLRQVGYDVRAVHPHDGPGLTERLLGVGVPSIRRSFEQLADHGPRAPGLIGGKEPARVLAATAPKLVIFSDSTPVANIAAKEAAWAARVPYVSVAHLGGAHPDVDVAPLRKRLAEVYERALHVVGVSSHTVEQVRRFADRPLPTAVVIFNGVAEMFFKATNQRNELRHQFGVGDRGVLGISVGRVDTHKGYAIVQNALGLVGGDVDLQWIWVGGGPGLSRARALAAMHPGGVRLLGERSDIPELLGAADMFGLPTYRDSFCLAAVEAMATGLPVAVSAVDGIPEIVGDAARLLPDPNRDADLTTKALAEALREWSLEATTRCDLGAIGRARAHALFRETRMGGDYLALVRSAIGPPGNLA